MTTPVKPAPVPELRFWATARLGKLTCYFSGDCPEAATRRAMAFANVNTRAGEVRHHPHGPTINP